MKTIETEHKLVALATKLSKRKFRWGLCDCNAGAAVVCDAVFGTNLGASILGRYDDEVGARAYAKEVDALDVLELNGFGPVSDNEFWPGDLIIVPYLAWYTCHVYINNGDVLCFGIQDKIRTVPLKLFTKTQFLHWRKK